MVALLLSHTPLKQAQIRKIWVSLKFLSAKFGLTPPPKRDQNEEKLYKPVENPQN